MNRSHWLASGLLLLLLGTRAEAAELVVVEAHGVRLAAGQSIDGSKKLSLEDGQSLTLLDSDGHVLNLEGPYEDTPDAAAAAGGGGGDLRTAIAALATERTARTSQVGVVRGENDVRLPDPWVVDVTHPGTSCVRPGQSVVLWREAPLTETKVIFSPKDLSWHVSGTWPAASDRLEMPATMPLHDHTDYVIDLAGKLAPVTVRLIPPAVDNDAMRIGFMNEIGCGNQAGALIAIYQK